MYRLTDRITAPASPFSKPTALMRPPASPLRCGSNSTARSPTTTSPFGVNATTEGSSALPLSGSGITCGRSPSMTAIRLLVVPRSMPKIRLISRSHRWFQYAIDVTYQRFQIGDVRQHRFQLSHQTGAVFLSPFRKVCVELFYGVIERRL